MPSKTYNKIVIGGTTYLDLSKDTVTADKILSGYTAHDKNGAPITGTATSSSVVISDTTDPAGGTIRTITAQDSVKLQTKTITPTSSVQTVSPDTGYDGFSQVTVEAGGGSSTPTIQTLSVTPSETQQTFNSSSVDGYKPVTVAAIDSEYVGSGVTKKAAATITPGTINQTIAAGTYLTGTQTISGDSDLVAGNIKSGVQIFGVTGTYEGSGGGGSDKNIQAYHGMDYARATSYTATDVTLTVAKAGTYKVSWMGFRNTNSGTNGSQLYKNGSAVGSAHTTFTQTYGQYCTETLTFAAGDVLVVRARSRSTTYYMYVGNLIIEEQ